MLPTKNDNLIPDFPRTHARTKQLQPWPTYTHASSWQYTSFSPSALPIDTGNNDYIATTVVKANFPPYGVSFPNHLPTGRFSDGRLVPDFLASALGIRELVPPFLNPSLSDKDLRTGVSFASAGSNFDSLTTAVSGVIPVADQPGLFKQYVEMLKASVGEEKANKIISESLIVISAGTNDFVLNWYDLPSSRRLQFFNDIGLYQNFILEKLGDLIKVLFYLLEDDPVIRSLGISHDTVQLFRGI
ncbi:hypothetical protein ACLOJK_023258 [Asimina triloba]